MAAALSEQALDQLFRSARSHNGFAAEAVSDETLVKLHDLMKWGPTGANGCPARMVFVRSAEAKARLRPALAPGNIEKTMAAPVTAIVGRDMAFYEHLPRLFPHTDARSWFAGNPAAIESAATLNAALQGGYLIMAARALGLDCGPMSGFDSQQVDREFFAGTAVRSFMLVNLGRGDPAKLFPRSPRFEFTDVCSIV